MCIIIYIIIYIWCMYVLESPQLPWISLVFEADKAWLQPCHGKQALRHPTCLLTPAIKSAEWCSSISKQLFISACDGAEITILVDGNHHSQMVYGGYHIAAMVGYCEHQKNCWWTGCSSDLAPKSMPSERFHPYPYGWIQLQYSELQQDRFVRGRIKCR